MSSFFFFFFVRKFLFLSEGAIIIRRWGPGDDAVGGFWEIPRFRILPLGYVKVPSSGFIGLVTSGLSNLQRGISFLFQGYCRLYCLMGLKLIPFFCLFACRIKKGQEETSTSQAKRKRGTPREKPTVSSAMFVEELRSFSQVPTDIRLEVADGATASTTGEADNAVYFTREQVAARLHFPIQSLVK